MNKSFDGKRLGIEKADKLSGEEWIELAERYFENDGKAKSPVSAEKH